MKVNLSILHAFFHGTLYIQMSNKRTLRTGCACVIGDETRSYEFVNFVIHSEIAKASLSYN